MVGGLADGVRRYSVPTTQFDRLCKRALRALYPDGTSTASFRAPRGAQCYLGGVRPDFVLPDGRWIDFKFHVSYREHHSVAWKPSALYASLRKYIDHVENPTKSLIIVYKEIHGSIRDVKFPIMRGRTVLLLDEVTFRSRVEFVDVRRLYDRLRKANAGWIVEALEQLG